MTSHLTFGLGALGAMLLTASATAQTPAPTESPVATASPSPTAAPAAIEAEPPVTQKVLEKYDTNKDGVLSPEERAVWEKDRAARRAARLKKYDKNGDGKLDESERAAMRKDKEAEKAAKEAEKIKEQEKPGQ